MPRFDVIFLFSCLSFSVALNSVELEDVYVLEVVFPSG
jgi:hypothetical protein